MRSSDAGESRVAKRGRNVYNGRIAARGEGKIAASATPADIGKLITRTPGVRGGRPCVAGTGVSVMRIANYSNMGYTPEEIAIGYGHLTLAQVYAALAYYHANKEEIDAASAEEEALSCNRVSRTLGSFWESSGATA